HPKACQADCRASESAQLAKVDGRTEHAEQQSRIDGMAHPLVWTGTNQAMILLDRDDGAPVAAEDRPGPCSECESGAGDDQSCVLNYRRIRKDVPIERAKPGSFAKQEPEGRGHQRKVDEPGPFRLDPGGPRARRGTGNPEDSPEDSYCDPHPDDQVVQVKVHHFQSSYTLKLLFNIPFWKYMSYTTRRTRHIIFYAMNRSKLFHGLP